MATLDEQFQQAINTVRARKDEPDDAPRQQVRERLESLYRAVREGAADEREAAMLQYIELAGDLGQEDG